MRIHSDKITTADVRDAARRAAANPVRLTEHRSRKRDHAYDVILEGHAPHRINSAEFGDLNAASWDAWGIFLAYLFEIDPAAECWAYDGWSDFHRKTGDRFHVASGGVASASDPRFQHTHHRWVREGDAIVCGNKRHGACAARFVR